MALPPMRQGSSAGIIRLRDENFDQGGHPMSIFPTTILLATDGSEEPRWLPLPPLTLLRRLTQSCTCSPWDLIYHSTSCPSTPPTSKMCYGKTDARPRRCSSSRPRG